MKQTDAKQPSMGTLVGHGVGKLVSGVGGGVGGLAEGAGEGAGEAVHGLGEAVRGVGHAIKRVAFAGEDSSEHDPQGMPLNRTMNADEVTPTSSGIKETSATPLTGKPAAYEVGQSDPGQPAAPLIPVRQAMQSAIPEIKQPSHNLPDAISAREVVNDAASYVDGRCGNVGWGAK